MNIFTITKLGLPGVLLIVPQTYEDARGTSMTTYQAQEFAALGIATPFVQEYVSFSKKGVIRGMHYQRAPYAQDKLIRCIGGRVLDVVADCDPTSQTFGQRVSIELDANKKELLYVPGCYAHGFCVQSDEATVEYKMSVTYHPESAGGIRYDDPLLAIAWPVADPILSDQDKAWPFLAPSTS